MINRAVAYFLLEHAEIYVYSGVRSSQAVKQNDVICSKKDVMAEDAAVKVRLQMRQKKLSAHSCQDESVEEEM